MCKQGTQCSCNSSASDVLLRRYCCANAHGKPFQAARSSVEQAAFKASSTCFLRLVPKRRPEAPRCAY